MGPPWIGQVGRGKSSVGEFVSSNSQTQPRGSRLSPFYLFLLLEDTGEKLQRYKDQAVSPGFLLEPSLRSLCIGSPNALSGR